MSEEMEMLYEKLTHCFETRKFADLRMTLLDMEPADIAQFMENNLEEKEQIMFFRLLPKELASDVFIETETDKPQILCVYGHSYEMDFEEDAWARLEDLFAYLANREDIFYGTMKEVLT